MIHTLYACKPYIYYMQLVLRGPNYAINFDSFTAVNVIEKQ